MSIDIQRIGKRFGNFTALDDVSLSVADGELVALLGPSGCGKTTLLRIVAGLESADTGRLMLGGTDATRLHARDRRVGFVFQHYALFAHMSVFENIAFGLRVRPRASRPNEAAIAEKVRSLLALVQLDHVGGRLPSQLSGGQRQRIALARALAVDPAVLLLDEPFGALDAKVRKELRRWLRRLHDELDVASVFVTHDQDEALEVADRVVVMNRGHIEQVATPSDLRAAPATPFVYDFLGDAIRLEGRARAGHVDFDGLQVERPEYRDIADAHAWGFVRPYELDVLRADRPAEDRQGIVAQLHRVVELGPIARLELSRDGGEQEFDVQLPIDRVTELAATPGDRLLLRPRRLQVFVDPAAAR